jgi:hypothetical protein
MLHCVHVPYSLHPFISWCTQFVSIVSWQLWIYFAAMNKWIQCSLWPIDLISLGYIQSIGIYVSYSSSTFNFRGTYSMFSIMSVLIYTSTNNMQVPLLKTSWLEMYGFTFSVSNLFYWSMCVFMPIPQFDYCIMVAYFADRW